MLAVGLLYNYFDFDPFYLKERGPINADTAAMYVDSTEHRESRIEDLSAECARYELLFRLDRIDSIPNQCK